MQILKCGKPATIRNLIDMYQDDPCIQIYFTRGYYIDIPHIKRKKNGRILWIHFMLFKANDRDFFKEFSGHERAANEFLNELYSSGIEFDEQVYEKYKVAIKTLAEMQKTLRESLWAQSFDIAQIALEIDKQSSMPPDIDMSEITEVEEN